MGNKKIKDLKLVVVNNIENFSRSNKIREKKTS